eukprot:10610137-Ditylum_brightwellii.AAC.1
MNPRGITCMMSGYAVNNTDGVYRMWNPASNRVLVSQDVTWLKRMFFQPINPPPELVVNTDSIDIEDRESGGKAVSSAAEPDEDEA